MLNIPPTSSATPAPWIGPDDAAAPATGLATAGSAGHDAGATSFDKLFGPPPARLALYADKNGGGGAGATKTARSDPLANVALPGQKGVVIQRSIGDPAGYATQNHAVAWARAAGSDRAMVVRTKDGRWHAVETNTVGKNATATGALTQALQIGKVDRGTYDALRAEAMKGNDAAKWKTFAAYALAIPESEIVVIGKGDTPVSDKVNINLSPDFDAEGRTAGFDPNQPPWIQLGPTAFNRPANAVSTLAHEEVHAEHRRLTADLYAQYQKSAHGHQSFRDWAASNVKDVRKVDIVAGYADGALAATELEAHVEAARVSFASGDLDQARIDLLKVRGLPNLPLLKTQLASIGALKEMRDGLPPDARRVFDEVAKKARDNTVLHGL